jgi:hypothetical protein
VRAERSVLGLELDNRLPGLLWKAVLSLRRQRKEAGHPVGLKAGDLAVQRAFGYAGLTGAFGGSVSEEHDGPQQLVGALLGKSTQQLQLLPVIGRFDPLTSRSGHDDTLSATAAQHAVVGQFASERLISPFQDIPISAAVASNRARIGEVSWYQGANSFQCPSDTTSTVPSITLMAV